MGTHHAYIDTRDHRPPTPRRAPSKREGRVMTHERFESRRHKDEAAAIRARSAEFLDKVAAKFGPLDRSVETAEPAVEVAPEPVRFDSPVLTSHIRGGGIGGSAWVALITGKDDKFGLARRSVGKERNTSKSGRSGRIYFTLDAPGYYELRGMQYEAGVASIGTLDSSFILVGPDGSYERVTKADVIKAMGA